MNIFDLYPLPEGYVPESPNWMFDGQRFWRSDSFCITRSTTFAGWLVECGSTTSRITARETLSPHDTDALRFASLKWPLPQPRARVGMVIAGSDGELSIIEVRRKEGVDLVRTSVDTSRFVAWDALPDPSAIVAGPGSPWASPAWYLQVIESSPPPEVH